MTEKDKKVYKEIDKQDYRKSIDLIVDELVRQADSRETVTDIVKYLADTYGLEKPVIRKIAAAVYKNSIEDEEAKNDQFTELLDLYSS